MNRVEKFRSEINERSLIATTINDHLIALFNETLSINPQTIVELGVEFGETTFVLERVARLTGAKLVSVDIQDCSRVSTYDRWLFVQQDDIQFAREFVNWSHLNNVKTAIDILMIDSSHLYEHTCQEIQAWFPFLAPKAKVFFHDTNINETVFRRNGSSFGGWNNERGVIRALETHFNQSFNETQDFTESINGWWIKHDHNCGGFTILERGIMLKCENTFVTWSRYLPRLFRAMV